MDEVDWALARCEGDEMFVSGAEQNLAKLVCRGCPILQACGEEAIRERVEWGVWGGMTERERRALHKRNGNPLPEGSGSIG